MSSNPTQGAYLPFPLSMLMHPPQPPPSRDEPPARVRLALALLHQMQEHAGKRYCMTEQHGGEEFDGNALVSEEVRARGAALDLLINYFRGELKPSGEEKDKSYLAKLEAGFQQGGNAMRCPCLATGSIEAMLAAQGKPTPTPGRGRSDCPLCLGSGRIMVLPLAPDTGGP